MQSTEIRRGNVGTVWCEAGTEFMTEMLNDLTSHLAKVDIICVAQFEIRPKGLTGTHCLLW